MRSKRWQLLPSKVKKMTDKIKTGTTCIGLLFKGGVLLAADRRVTSYKIDSDRFTKLFDVSDKIISTVSGMASDAQLFMRIIKGELKLLSLRTERSPYVSEAAMMLNSMQYSSLRTSGSIVGLILGGHDIKDGFTLYNLGPDGTIVPHEGYVTNGSGSIYVTGVLNTEYKDDLSEKEALALVEKAFTVAFKNDNASGGGFVARVVTEDGIKEVDKKIVKTEMVSEK